MERRKFLNAMLATAVSAPMLRSQAAAPDWGGPVLDTHLHLRGDADACFTHISGCGVSNAVLLTPASAQERAKQEMEKRPGHFVRSVSTDPSGANADQILRDALKNGAVSIGEMKYHLDLNSPEMRRVYDVAAEMGVPVMMHIQTFPHFPGEQPYNTGFEQFAEVLRAFPKTTFIGHADLFWANIAADVPKDRGYPDGPIRKPGLTDMLLASYPNLYADMSANSGNNALARDKDFSKDFIQRHRNKLIFGSDCACSDGNGAGISQGNNPEAARLAGKCVARETLALLKELASPEVFRMVTWTNGARLFRVS